MGKVSLLISFLIPFNYCGKKHCLWSYCFCFQNQKS
jgi:hypothetical protein